jgi:hypothetical protein
MPIRRPAPFDRLKEKSSVDASFCQHFDVLYVKDKLPNLDPKVATRLGKMISRCRQLIFTGFLTAKAFGQQRWSQKSPRRSRQRQSPTRQRVALSLAK